MICRYAECAIATHNQQELPAVGAMVLADLKEKSLQYSVIGIDEGQFVSFLFVYTLLDFEYTALCLPLLHQYSAVFIA